MRVDVPDGDDGEREKSHQRIENADRHPHIAKRFREYAFGLLFHEIRRALEAGDPEQRRGKAVEDGPSAHSRSAWRG